MIDKKAMELIRKSYRKSISEEEKAYCREKGLLMAHEPVTHNKAVMQIHELSTKISLESAARSFLYSISSGDRRYRTILSSLIWAKRLPAHYHKRETRSYLSPACTICGMALSRHNDKTDLPMLEYANQSLFPTRRNMDICCAGYVLHDLLQFMNLPAADFVEEDLRILRRILGLAEEISTTNKVNALLNLISAETSLSLTVTDAYSILGVLSSCGVFDTPELKSYASGFVRCDDRQFVYETDNYYPLHLWRGKYGINYSAIDDFFGKITDAKISSECSLRGSVVREERDLSSGSPKAEAFYKDDEHLIDLDNRQRYIYGLTPLDPTWDRVIMYSSTYETRKRTEIFFEGNRIRKIIYEWRNTIHKLRSGEFNGYYIESDMDVVTRNRQMILPKTDRGREQTLTPSHLMIPTFMLAQLHVTLGGSRSGISSFNSSNDQTLPVPQTPAESREDFTRITEEYIASCPSDYQRDLDRFILNKRVRVRYTAGDIFRVQTSMNQYTYGLIIGKIRQLEKWPEVPKGHPIQLMMTQPVIYRQYDILTSNPDMTTEELSSIPLLDIYMADDSEILFATYPVVDHKDLVEDDIDLGFGMFAQIRTIVWGLSMQTFDVLTWMKAGFDEKYSDPLCKSGEGRLIMTYGAGMSIRIEKGEEKTESFLRRRENEQKQKEKVIRVLGLDPENAYDDFARRSGGLTRQQYIDIAKVRYR